MWYSNSFWFIPQISSLIDPQDKHSARNEIISKRLIDFLSSPLLASEFSFKWASLCPVRQVCIYEFLWLLQAAEWALNKKWMLAAKFVVLYLVDELIIRLSPGLWLVSSLQYCSLIGQTVLNVVVVSVILCNGPQYCGCWHSWLQSLTSERKNWVFVTRR